MNIEEVIEVLNPETETERKIIWNPEFVEGCSWGKPRDGHPEGKVLYHIEDVLKNIEIYFPTKDRYDLRIIALVHDTFKYKVDRSRPKIGENSHGMLARKFLENYLSDEKVLDIVELHDEAHLSWLLTKKGGNIRIAEERARNLIKRLQDSSSLELYLSFYKCDNMVQGKERDNYLWFRKLTEAK